MQIKVLMLGRGYKLGYITLNINNLTYLVYTM